MTRSFCSAAAEPQDVPARGKLLQHSDDGAALSVLPQEQAREQRQRQQRHHNKGDGAEHPRQANVGVGGGGKTARQPVVDRVEGRKHKREHGREHGDDQQQHRGGIGERGAQPVGNVLLPGVVARQAEEHVLQPARVLAYGDHPHGVFGEDPRLFHRVGQGAAPGDPRFHLFQSALEHALAAFSALEE